MIDGTPKHNPTLGKLNIQKASMKSQQIEFARSIASRVKSGALGAIGLSFTYKVSFGVDMRALSNG